MTTRPARTSPPVLVLVVVAAGGVLTACSDDDPTGPDATIVGSWVATSFTALGMDFIAGGMTLEATLSDSGTYTFVVTNDLVGVCGGDGGEDCQTTGPYTSTASQITIDAGEEDEVTFNYTVTSTTMNWSGSIDGIPATVTFVRN